MPIIKVVTENDVGSGLAIVNNKLTAKVDGTTVQVNAQGQLTAIAQVDVKLQGAELTNDTTLHLTLSDNSTLDVDLSKFLNIDTDTKPTAVAVNGNDITITLSDGNTVTGSLADFKTALRHNQLQSLGGDDLGYTIA